MRAAIFCPLGNPPLPSSPSRERGRSAFRGRSVFTRCLRNLSYDTAGVAHSDGIEVLAVGFQRPDKALGVRLVTQIPRRQGLSRGAELFELRPDEEIVAWAFRFLESQSSALSTFL